MNNLTEIIFIIDKSGSMQNLVDDTIGGFNGFLESQKEQPGQAVLTTILFNDGNFKLHDRVDIREVPRMDRTQYRVGGGTAMLDAIGGAIDGAQLRIDKLPAEERPDHVICVITTDGMENSSTRYNKATIQRMIDHQTNGHGWKFIFLGANMDAVREAANIGIYDAATWTANTVGVNSAYASVDCAVTSMRCDGTLDAQWSKALQCDETGVLSTEGWASHD